MLFIGNFEHRRGDQFHFALESTDCNPLDFFSTRFKYESVQNAVEKLTKDRTRSVRLKTENEIGDPLWLVITFSLQTRASSTLHLTDGNFQCRFAAPIGHCSSPPRAVSKMLLGYDCLRISASATARGLDAIARWTLVETEQNVGLTEVDPLCTFLCCVLCSALLLLVFNLVYYCFILVFHCLSQSVYVCLCQCLSLSVSL